jgi:hypothetical protein
MGVLRDITFPVLQPKGVCQLAPASLRVTFPTVEDAHASLVTRQVNHAGGLRVGMSRERADDGDIVATDLGIGAGSL